MKLLMPYIVYLVTYIIFVTVIFQPGLDNTFDNEETGLNDITHLMITTALCVLSFYFLKNELRSLKSNGLSYFKDFWNYVDIIPPIMILIIVGLDYYPEHHNEKAQGTGIYHTHTHEEIIYVQYALQAIANFAMWFKIFYFLRIFR